jgi:FlaA1/EpsC-like NDP-sugar epimerase
MAAERYGVKKMVMISTDKAVKPTNVMGASKRICEMIIQSMKNSKTEYVAVRFGNVLGSNGSVIPLFKKQIEKGGPVTITDKRIIRYFMTIPEAVQLVMQAGVMAAKSEIFVLDMGAPVKIYDLATNMITLSGLVPEVDIKIEEIGLRPGEKLYEELLVNTEVMTKTDNEKIFIEHVCEENRITKDELQIKLEILKKALKSGDNDNETIKKAMMEIVPTYKTPEDVNLKFFEIKPDEKSINSDEKFNKVIELKQKNAAV